MQKSNPAVGHHGAITVHVVYDLLVFMGPVHFADLNDFMVDVLYTF